MAFTGSRRYTFQQLNNEIYQRVKDKDFLSKLYESTNNIANIVLTIRLSNGHDWAAQLKDNEGKSLLTPSEQQQFTRMFQPYVQTIIDYFDAPLKHDTVTKKGGANEDNLTETINETTNNSQPENTKLNGNINGAQPGNINNAQSGNTNGAQSGNTKLNGNRNNSQPGNINGDQPGNRNKNEAQAPQPSARQQNETQKRGIDDLFTHVLDYIRGIDSTVNSYASQYGILHLEKKFNREDDIPLIPDMLSNLTVSINPELPAILKRIRVPFRLIESIIYLILDISRISFGLLGEDEQRKSLSIIVALIDLLKGDWKKSIASFMGFFGTSPMLMGEYMKIFLYLFGMLSPTIQDNFFYEIGRAHV